MSMNLVMMVIGAYDGSKLTNWVEKGTEIGVCLLIEPVPFLFEKLRKRYEGISNLILLNKCIVSDDVEFVAFNAPKINLYESKNSAMCQWGSVIQDHVQKHDSAMVDSFEVIRVPAISINNLILSYQIETLHTLIVDTEGCDVDILSVFPFEKILPERIIFEFKHSDGPFRLGKKLGSLLIKLDELGYFVEVESVENLIATRKAR